MYKAHPVFICPSDPDVKIWRYMDIAKYLSLLEKRSLFFTRADLLGDPFEGSLPSTQGQINIDDIVKVQAAKHLGLNPDQIESPTSIHAGIRRNVFVCSFHMNDYESAALWSIYSKANQGVAVQSTFSRLIDCFKEYSRNSILIGKMNYIDYNTEVIDVFKNTLFPIVHKRKSFEHEKELRAVVFYPKEFYREISSNPPQGTYDSDSRGIYVDVDLNALIERIYVAPTTEPWINDLLISITQKYGIDKPIKQSSLDANPII
jgi:hypothetical protein